MVVGYFVMLKFPARDASYWVHSFATAGRDVRGTYFSELLYQIDVAKRPPNMPHGSIFTKRPASFRAKAEQVRKRLADDPSTLNEFNNIWGTAPP